VRVNFPMVNKFSHKIGARLAPNVFNHYSSFPE
jgi:hypothetical protein